MLAFFYLIALPTPAAAITVDAKGAVLIDASSGVVLYEQNAHTELPPASTTKVATALLVLENMPLNKVVTVPDGFVNAGEAGIWLEPGEEQTVEDLMYAMLLRSANDAAQVLAIATAGSEQAFVDMMNKRVAELGLKNTHFTNPHGLHDDNHYTSAYDLAQITRAACALPVFNKIIVTDRHQLPWVKGEYDRVVYNRNNLLNIYEYADGVKNGYTTQAGSCLVSSATKNGTRLIAVLLNSHDMYEQSKALLEYGFANYHQVTLIEAENVMASLPVTQGKNDMVKVKAAQTLTTLLPNTEKNTPQAQINLPASCAAPVAKGDVLGNITYKLSDGSEISTELIAASDVKIHKFSLILSSMWHDIWSLFDIG